MTDLVKYPELPAGKSKGCIIRLDDGYDYVVKFLRRGYEKILPNEWIGYCLARFLELPVPFSRIVEVPEAVFTLIPNMTDVTYTGRQFATMYIPCCVNLRQVSDVESVVNFEAFAGIILLDYWLGNRDRNRNNVLLREEKRGAYRLWMIDHGDIFGSFNWTASQMGTPSMELYPSATHQWMARFIPAERAFTEYLKVMRTIPKLLIEEIVAQIPSEWCVSDEDRQAIVEQLIFRRDKQMEELMCQFITKVYRIYGIRPS